jgi:hypothetical protein
MRNPTLAVAIALALAAPCTALVILGCSPSLADDKPKESLTFGSGTVKQDYQPQKPDGSGRIGSPTMQKKHIGPPKYEDVQSQSNGPLNTTANPALQGNVLQKGTVGGSTGPTKPTLPTTGGRNQ